MNHPKGLYLLYVTEMWERFSYYGMRALFVLFLVKALLFSHEKAVSLYGDFIGLVYLTPLLGGYISDRYWGNRKSITFGACLMAFGHFFLFLSASFYRSSSSFPLWFLYIGLFFLIFGNAFFKPNVSTMVGQLYPSNDARLDSAYTIFYMGINVGGFFSPLVCGTLGDTSNPADFRWGFLAACIGMLVSLFGFLSLKNKYLVAPSGSPIGLKPKQLKSSAPFSIESFGSHLKSFLLYSIASLLIFFLFFKVFNFDFFASLIFSLCLVVPFYVVSDPSLTLIEKHRIWVIYILAFLLIFFWAAYEQAGASLTLFTDECVNRNLGGFYINTSYFQSVNPVFVVLFAPVLSFLWSWLDKKHFHISVCHKMALGMFILSVGYAVLALGTYGVPSSVRICLFWIISYYLLSAIGELCLSPIGLSFVNKLAPARFASLLMGIWFMSNAAADKCSGLLGSLYPTAGSAPAHFLGFSINSVCDFFLLFVFLTLATTIVLLLLSPWLQRKMHFED